MPKQNRVTSFGDIVVSPLRGAWTGSRDQLHVGDTIMRFYGSDLWITSALEFRDRKSLQWLPRHYTFLFFHDEAVALAAGHRPCGACRRGASNAYRTAWADAFGEGIPAATGMNRQLHRERIVAGTRRRQLHDLPWRDLPDGTFVSVHERPYLVLRDEIVLWNNHGYGARLSRPLTGTASVITPPSSVAVLRAGYLVQIDPSASADWIAGT